MNVKDTKLKIQDPSLEYEVLENIALQRTKIKIARETKDMRDGPSTAGYPGMR